MTRGAILRTGDIVRIRDQRWRVVSHAIDGDTSIVDAAGLDSANSGHRAEFILPFEPVDRLPFSVAPKFVRPNRWRRVARHVLGNASPSFTSLRAAKHAHLTVIPYQLEPALALIRGDACRLLIADGVGLGKTVQAGLMIAELLHRRRDARVLVVTPAALRQQWREELGRRFSVDAEVFDAATVARIEGGLHGGINPWAVRRVIVTSVDYIKRVEVVRALEALTWDLTVFDEAHNLSGRSDRAAAAHEVATRSRAVVLLTATPHSGDEQAFRRLCSLGDIGNSYPLLLFRRSRSHAGLPTRRRTVLLRVRPTAAEAAMHRALMTYARRAWHESSGGPPGARLAMTVLARRACSSAGALARSVERRLALLKEPTQRNAQFDIPFADVTREDEAPDVCLASPGLRNADEEHTCLLELLELARIASLDESKFCCLRRLLRRIREPAIIFTEYRDTLERLARQVADIGSVQLHGQLTLRERTEVLSHFTAGGAPLLLATDAASEGLNLQHRCRLVVNLELPWTPVRLDQRVGRVDRIGQSRTVHAIRLAAAGTCEESILARLASRAERMHDALEVAPDERAVAESVLGLKPIPAGGTLGPASGTAVIHVALHRQAVEEAERLGRAAAWLRSDVGPPEGRPVVTRLRRRHGSSGRCLWAFRVTFGTAAGHVLWRTVVGADASFTSPLIGASSASSTRARLGCSAVNRVIDASHSALVESTRDMLRASIELSLRREHDLMKVIRRHHARMSAALLQGSLFDRRNDRAAASQAATRDEALSACHRRIEELRACEHVELQDCDLAFAVVVE